MLFVMSNERFVTDYYRVSVCLSVCVGCVGTDHQENPQSLFASNHDLFYAPATL